jgi:hypothetical protein
MKYLVIFFGICLPLFADTNNITPNIVKVPIETINENLQENYNLHIRKQTKLTGTVIIDYNTNLTRTYTVLKIEF